MALLLTSIAHFSTAQSETTLQSKYNDAITTPMLVSYGMPNEYCEFTRWHFLDYPLKKAEIRVFDMSMGYAPFVRFKDLTAAEFREIFLPGRLQVSLQEVIQPFIDYPIHLLNRSQHPRSMGFLYWQDDRLVLFALWVFEPATLSALLKAGASEDELSRSKRLLVRLWNYIEEAKPEMQTAIPPPWPIE